MHAFIQKSGSFDYLLKQDKIKKKWIRKSLKNTGKIRCFFKIEVIKLFFQIRNVSDWCLMVAMKTNTDYGHVPITGRGDSPVSGSWGQVRSIPVKHMSASTQ